MTFESHQNKCEAIFLERKRRKKKYSFMSFQKCERIGNDEMLALCLLSPSSNWTFLCSLLNDIEKSGPPSVAGYFLVLLK
jgi:hypothetical protein